LSLNKKNNVKLINEEDNQELLRQQKLADQKLRDFSKILRMSEKLDGSDENVKYDYQENIIVQSQVMNENVSQLKN
jgi:hypothetical protein